MFLVRTVEKEIRKVMVIRSKKKLENMAIKKVKRNLGTEDSKLLNMLRMFCDKSVTNPERKFCSPSQMDVMALDIAPS